MVLLKDVVQCPLDTMLRRNEPLAHSPTENYLKKLKSRIEMIPCRPIWTKHKLC